MLKKLNNLGLLENYGNIVHVRLRLSIVLVMLCTEETPNSEHSFPHFLLPFLGCFRKGEKKQHEKNEKFDFFHIKSKSLLMWTTLNCEGFREWNILHVINYMC